MRRERKGGNGREEKIRGKEGEGICRTNVKLLTTRLCVI